MISPSLGYSQWPRSWCFSKSLSGWEILRRSDKFIIGAVGWKMCVLELQCLLVSGESLLYRVYQALFRQDLRGSINGRFKSRKSINLERNWCSTAVQPQVLWFVARQIWQKGALSFDVKETVGYDDCEDPIYCLCSTCMIARRSGEHEAFNGYGDVNDDLLDERQFKLPPPSRQACELRQKALLREDLLDEDVFDLILFAWAPLRPLFPGQISFFHYVAPHSVLFNQFVVSLMMSQVVPNRRL